ncbi:hypothetical protein BDR26DRAFT_849718 [Obelidium mucronatum]|nr:hypothetical protein BDR26DRAFT_849718 [Obelidium mucronatum]
MTTRSANMINDALAQAQFAEKKWVWVHDNAEGYVASWIVEEHGEQVVVELQDGSVRLLTCQQPKQQINSKVL